MVAYRNVDWSDVDVVGIIDAVVVDVGIARIVEIRAMMDDVACVGTIYEYHASGDGDDDVTKDAKSCWSNVAGDLHHVMSPVIRFPLDKHMYHVHLICAYYAITMMMM